MFLLRKGTKTTNTIIMIICLIADIQHQTQYANSYSRKFHVKGNKVGLSLKSNLEQLKKCCGKNIKKHKETHNLHSHFREYQKGDI